MAKNEKAEIIALRNIIELLSGLDKDSQARVLRTVSTFFATEPNSPSTSYDQLSLDPEHAGNAFSNREDLTPKDFLAAKEPRSDVERVACLAFYLSHYRETPHFKTAEISKLNTEAAQPKLSNTAHTVSNSPSHRATSSTHFQDSCWFGTTCKGFGQAVGQPS